MSNDYTIMCVMGDLFLCTNAFNNLRKQKLSIKASMQVNRIAKALSAELEILNGAKDEIISKYQALDESGNPQKGEGDTVKLNNPDEFKKEWEELMATGVVLPVRKLKLSELSNIEMSPEDIELIMFIIEDEEETDD